MAILYIHAGHSKTGTSWLQAALRENSTALARCGLAYPILGGVGDQEDTEIGQGNGLALATCPDDTVAAGLSTIAHAAAPAGVVLSSEEFFSKLTFCDDPAIFPQATQTAGFERIELLLFIRNPVGHAASLWQQYLKTGGGSVPIEALFEKYRIPESVAQFLDRFMFMENVRVTCLNYDRHRKDLLTPLCAWLGQPENALTPPKASNINRGMTRSELALQVALNRQIGKAGRVFSDALCCGLPDLIPDRIYPDISCQKAMIDRLASALARVNAYLPEEERYRCDFEPDSEEAVGETLTFSLRQIETIGAALGREIRRLRLEVSAQRLRDGALER